MNLFETLDETYGNVLELFGGSCSFSNVAKELGFATFTTDWEAYRNIDYATDILEFSVNQVPFKPDIIWASPPCQCFSIAVCSHNWTTDGKPKLKSTVLGVAYMDKAVEIIAHFKPKYWFIENPRGMMRQKIWESFRRHGIAGIRNTVTYCQYGDTRMKPTDIFTNCYEWKPRPMCSPCDPCHERSPRGDKSGGTQGMNDAYDRSIVPFDLCLEILNCLHL